MVSERENEEREARLEPAPESEPLIPTPVETAPFELEDVVVPSTETEEPAPEPTLEPEPEPVPEPEPSPPAAESESPAPAGERWDQNRIDRVEALRQVGLSDYLADRPWVDISNPVRADLRPIVDRMPDR